MKKKELNLVIEKTNQSFIAKKRKGKRYEQKISQFGHNQLFQVNQKQVYKKLIGEKVSDRIIPNSDDRTKFWNEIWSIRREHNKHAEFLKVSGKEFENVNSKEKAEITQEMVKMQCRKMPDWEASGKDGLKGYWLENLASLHPHTEVQVNHILREERPY